MMGDRHIDSTQPGLDIILLHLSCNNHYYSLACWISHRSVCMEWICMRHLDKERVCKGLNYDLRVKS